MPRPQILRFLLLALIVLLVSSCKELFGGKEERKAIARAGERFLYEDEIVSLLNNTASGLDSAMVVNNYINNWASKQLLLSKAKINLSEAKQAEFNRLVDNYKADLYTRAYTEALVAQSQDTAISKNQIRQFYEAEKQNFRLNEKVVQLRFVGLTPEFLDKEIVVERMKRFENEDKNFLDSIAVQFKKIHLNDSTWVGTGRLMEEIPPLTYLNQEKYLKKSQFFELQDSVGVYLGRIIDVLDINDIAPLSYVEPNIKQLILNRRRMDFIRKLETEILDEAQKKNEFEIYGKQD
ncbi:peptidyl-prolyl cis-trans isomerase [Croceivirga thetidis]|uniref:Peptidyl-prolyl cis-trans isomerase n=1 Tax=Croceivirga thetidis TaxID=2721623 RepID=A0ABX1GV48_9FLAO|nr:peptidyl-prolyl cis-trans isomerase [Croceivirga thetidis]NKI33499.1 peptidyl-prolyl cis-trans isomerase [Croceivirga thetidis]